MEFCVTLDTDQMTKFTLEDHNNVKDFISTFTTVCGNFKNVTDGFPKTAIVPRSAVPPPAVVVASPPAPPPVASITSSNGIQSVPLNRDIGNVPNETALCIRVKCAKCTYSLSKRSCNLLRQHVLNEHKEWVLNEAFVNECGFHLCHDCEAWTRSKAGNKHEHVCNASKKPFSRLNKEETKRLRDGHQAANAKINAERIAEAQRILEPRPARFNENQRTLQWKNNVNSALRTFHGGFLHNEGQVMESAAYKLLRTPRNQVRPRTLQSPQDMNSSQLSAKIICAGAKPGKVAPSSIETSVLI